MKYYTNETYERESGGFAFKISFEVDVYPDLSHYGTYHHDWCKGALDRETMGDLNRDEPRYFEPYPSFEELLAAKVDRPQAAKIVLANYRRCEAYNNDEWCMLGCTVKMYHSDVLIDQDSLWGIESDGSDEYIEEIINDMIYDLKASVVNTLDAQIKITEQKLARLTAKRNEIATLQSLKTRIVRYY